MLSTGWFYRLAWTEWLMIVVFVIGVVSWGFLMKGTAASLEGSFLAGRRVPGFMASLSTVATNLNVNDFIGGAGFFYAVGVVLAHGGLISGMVLIFVSLFLVQKLRRLNVFTLGDWLEKRYCSAVGIAYSITWSGVWMLFNLGLYIYGGALVLHTLVGWNLYVSIVILSIIAATYTLIGGFGAVVATDVLQLAMMFFPFVFLASMVWVDMGGPAGIAASLPQAKAIFWTNDTPFGSLVVMLGGILLMSISYWSCEAQVIQRPLSARNVEEASISYLGATFWFTVLCPLLIYLPALAAVSYFPGLENPDHAMPNLIKKFLPPGLYGVTIVGLIAGFFSSADSQINAFCSMFTMNIYKRLIRPGREDRHYLIASKILGAIFTLAAIGTALLFSTDWAKDGMMLFAISVLATIMPPFGAITIFGAVSRRANSLGALIGLITGGLTAIVLLFLSGMGILASVAGENTLYFRTMVTFLITFIIAYLVSLLQSPPAQDVVNMPETDQSIHFSPTIIRFIIVLLAGIVAMYIFWSYYFH